MLFLAALTTLAQPCVDTSRLCASRVSRGDCQRFPSTMSHSCAASCGLCGGPPIAVGRPVGPVIPQFASSCSDTSRLCASRVARGDCQRFPTTMTRTCAASCGACAASISVGPSIQFSQPQFAQPQFAQPQFAQPQFAQPQLGSSYGQFQQVHPNQYSQFQQWQTGHPSQFNQFQVAHPASQFGAQMASMKCENTCRYAFNGVCDDGIHGQTFKCTGGTDCQDCGPRFLPPPPSPSPPPPPPHPWSCEADRGSRFRSCSSPTFAYAKSSSGCGVLNMQTCFVCCVGPSTQQMQFVVPASARPGQTLQVSTPSGPVQVALPSTARPGHTVGVQVPTNTSPPPTYTATYLREEADAISLENEHLAPVVGLAAALVLASVALLALVVRRKVAVRRSTAPILV